MENNNESSEDKQIRMNCLLGIRTRNWDCYTDCAFWDGEKCTYGEEKEELK